MAIPDYQTLMLPFLRQLAAGEPRTLESVASALGEEFGLNEQELSQLLPSGRYPLFRNRVGWAKTYLKNAGLCVSPKRGMAQITDRGRAVLAKGPPRIDVRFLAQFAEFVEFRSRRRDAANESEADGQAARTPVEELEAAYERIRAQLEAELLERVRAMSPTDFEQLVVDLLVRMGYGGSHADAAKAVGRSGDGGIDGIIKEDRLGLDTIYVQAKRWDGVVGRPELQKFAGALQGVRARKGVFITTSSFSTQANEFIEKIDLRIVLLDGEGLVQAMIEHDLGVSLVNAYPVKRVDSDYFADE